MAGKFNEKSKTATVESDLSRARPIEPDPYKMQPRQRILLPVPHMSGGELRYVQDAFESNWLSTVGPNIGAFEGDLELRAGLPAAALSSGTAAIHLGLRLLGVGAGDGRRL
jgi:pyridoxal phosphate-dependent aminotransferase EpsN